MNSNSLPQLTLKRGSKESLKEARVEKPKKREVTVIEEGEEDSDASDVAGGDHDDSRDEEFGIAAVSPKRGKAAKVRHGGGIAVTVA